jgi:DNA-binding CsgD family transcriptional regulator
MKPTASWEPHALEQGRTALARGEWENALTLLERAVAEAPANGQAWECLAYAQTWLRREQQGIDTRQRAYAVYREQADDLAAARVCLDLVYDFAEVKGEPAIANGWLQRARRLLDEHRGPSAEHALLRALDASFVMASDLPAGETLAGEAVAIARAAGARDVEVLALAVRGLALVTGGRVAEGMNLLDEAVAGALGRDIVDPQWYYFACCCMIDACDRVRDFARALAWCDQLHAFAARWRVQAFLTTCRVKYTAALLWRGEWHAFEAQLEQAITEMADSRPMTVASACARLAELRRRQGRRAEAEALLARAAGHPLVLQVRAAIALDGDDASSALDLLDTILRCTPASSLTERLAALEMKTVAHARLGQTDEARETAAELAAIAERIGTETVRAASLFAAGVAAMAALETDGARRMFEDALFLCENGRSPYEAARVRVELARCHAKLDRGTSASAEVIAALAAFEHLGAAADVARARALHDEIDRVAESRSVEGVRGAKDLLTRRQRDVMLLVAEGLSDQEIAARLYLSEHTVHRHVANVMTRLGVSSRAAAVATALRSRLL